MRVRQLAPISYKVGHNILSSAPRVAVTKATRWFDRRGAKRSDRSVSRLIGTTWVPVSRSYWPRRPAKEPRLSLISNCNFTSAFLESAPGVSTFSSLQTNAARCGTAAT